MRFRPEQHLRRQSDFRTVREQGRRINCGAFTFLYLRRAPSAESVSTGSTLPDRTAPIKAASRFTLEPDSRRVGFVASTASVGHAVLRNRAKRRLREVFRRHQASVPAGYDLLLTARTAVTVWSFGELEQKFVEACRQLGTTHRST